VVATSTGSTLGRVLGAVPALLASVAVGLVAVGVGAPVAAGAGATAVLAAASLLRAARTGVTVDVERQELVLRGFWRTRRLDAATLARIDASRREARPGTVRIVLRDGRSYDVVPLSFLAEHAAERLRTDLARLGEPGTFEVHLAAERLRRPAG
jgi:hypothetical protein